MEDVLWWAGFVVVIGGLAWFAFWNEPHWVSKDGRRFTCRVSELDPHTGVPGRWRERHAVLEEDGTVRLGGKPTLRSMTRGGGFGEVIGDSQRVLARAGESRRSVLFLLEGVPVRTLRVPRSSKAVASLDAIAANPAPPP
jgi:hypothetical protein